MTKQKRGNIIQESFQYFSSQIIQQGVNIIRGVILPNILSPFHFGIVATLSLVERYSIYANLGIHSANLYQIPAKRVQGDLEESERIKNHVYSFSILTGGLAVLLILLGAFLNAGRISKEIFWGLLIVSMTPLLIAVRGVYMTLLRADKEFNILSTATLLMSTLGAVLMILMALKFKSYGVLLGEMIALVLVLCFIQNRVHFKFKFELVPQKVVALLQFSIPIFFLVGLLHTFLLTLDRLMIVKWLGVQQVGYYAIGVTLSNLVLLFPMAISVVLSTRVIEECSRPGGNTENILCQTTYLIAIFTSFLAAFLCFACPSIFKIVFPKYQAGIQSAMILPFAVYFEAIGFLPYYAMVGMGKMKSYILVTGVIAGVSYLLFNFMLREKNLLEIALLMVVIYFLKNMTTLLFSASVTMKNRRNISKFILLPLLFITFSAAISVFLNFIFPSPLNIPRKELLALFLLKSMILTVVYLPILFCFNKGTGLIRKTYEKCVEAVAMGEFLKRKVPPTAIQE